MGSGLLAASCASCAASAWSSETRHAVEPPEGGSLKASSGGSLAASAAAPSTRSACARHAAAAATSWRGSAHRPPGAQPPPSDPGRVEAPRPRRESSGRSVNSHTGGVPGYLELPRRKHPRRFLHKTIIFFVWGDNIHVHVKAGGQT